MNTLIHPIGVNTLNRESQKYLVKPAMQNDLLAHHARPFSGGGSMLKVAPHLCLNTLSHAVHLALSFRIEGGP